MITAVDLLRGLAALIGWERIEVPGATGYLDTDYAAKGRYAVEALDSTDIVCVHVEAPDEASHEGRADAKIAALEAIDEKIVAPLHAALKKHGDYRILVSPDHPRRSARRPTATALCPWRSAAPVSRPIRPRLMTNRLPRSRRSRSTRGGG
jgi:2,3-diphosphopglycerate-independent phosphoglycerate mutase